MKQSSTDNNKPFKIEADSCFYYKGHKATNFGILHAIKYKVLDAEGRIKVYVMESQYPLRICAVKSVMWSDWGRFSQAAFLRTIKNYVSSMRRVAQYIN